MNSPSKYSLASVHLPHSRSKRVEKKSPAAGFAGCCSPSGLWNLLNSLTLLPLSSCPLRPQFCHLGFGACCGLTSQTALGPPLPEVDKTFHSLKFASLRHGDRTLLPTSSQGSLLSLFCSLFSQFQEARFEPTSQGFVSLLRENTLDCSHLPAGLYW